MLTVLTGDAIEQLRTLPDESVQCCVTSPPYWGLRDYGTAAWEGGDSACDHKYSVSSPYNENFNERWGNASGAKKQESERHEVSYKSDCGKCGARRIDSQLGLEKTPEEYVSKMVEVFREVRRVLRKDGTLWLNLGDSYGGDRTTGRNDTDPDKKGSRLNSCGCDPTRTSVGNSGVKPKDLCGIPWRVAFALQADGWVLRSEIVWSKPNPMPESVTDRPTKAHEQLFLFSKAKWCGEDRRRFADISDEDARWLALFLDTEGNICCKRVKMDGRGDHFGAQICFASSNRTLLEVAQGIIKAGTILTRKGKNAPMFYLQMSNNQAADLLHRLWQFLIVKQRQASLAIYLQNVIADSGHERRTKVGRLRGRARGDEYTDELLRIWATMKQLNHFGNPDLSWMPRPKFGRWDSEPYFYDAEAIKEPVSFASLQDGRTERGTRGIRGEYAAVDGNCGFNPNGRNKRSVWTVTTVPYPEAHFATYPPDLIKPCILAGTSAKGCCVKCGSPWERIVERGEPSFEITRGTQSWTAVTGQRDSCGGLPLRDSKTIGWQPTCKHVPCGVIPCKVLDPFGGSGTTGMVALELGRKAVLIELNPKYCELIRQRCDVTPGLQLA